MEKARSNLQMLSPLAVLGRGYSIVTKPDGTIVKQARRVEKGEDLSVRLHEGGFSCQVTRVSGK